MALYKMWLLEPGILRTEIVETEESPSVEKILQCQPSYERGIASPSAPNSSPVSRPVPFLAEVT